MVQLKTIKDVEIEEMTTPSCTFLRITSAGDGRFMYGMKNAFSLSSIKLYRPKRLLFVPKRGDKKEEYGVFLMCILVYSYLAVFSTTCADFFFTRNSILHGSLRVHFHDKGKLQFFYPLSLLSQLSGEETAPARLKSFEEVFPSRATGAVKSLLFPPT